MGGNGIEPGKCCDAPEALGGGGRGNRRVVLGAALLLVASLGAPALTPASSAVAAPATTPVRLFGTYAKGQYLARRTVVSAMIARYGAFDVAVPAWHSGIGMGADSFRAPPSAATIEAVNNSGVFAALEVCAYRKDWLAERGQAFSWSQAKGTACVQQVAHDLGPAVSDLVAVEDGHQIDEFATPAEQVYMYQLMKQYFPNSVVISYHGCELKASGREPGQTDGGWGSAGRSADIVFFRQNCGLVPQELRLVAKMESATGPEKIMLFVNASQFIKFGKSAPSKVDTVFQTAERLSATILPIWAFEVRPLDKLDASEYDPIAAEIAKDMPAWVDGGGG